MASSSLSSITACFLFLALVDSLDTCISSVWGAVCLLVLSSHSLCKSASCCWNCNSIAIIGLLLVGSNRSIADVDGWFCTAFGLIKPPVFVLVADCSCCTGCWFLIPVLEIVVAGFVSCPAKDLLATFEPCTAGIAQHICSNMACIDCGVCCCLKLMALVSSLQSLVAYTWGFPINARRQRIWLHNTYIAALSAIALDRNASNSLSSVIAKDKTLNMSVYVGVEDLSSVLRCFNASTMFTFLCNNCKVSWLKISESFTCWRFSSIPWQHSDNPTAGHSFSCSILREIPVHLETFVVPCRALRSNEEKANNTEPF